MITYQYVYLVVIFVYTATSSFVFTSTPFGVGMRVICGYFAGTVSWVFLDTIGSKSTPKT